MPTTVDDVLPFLVSAMKAAPRPAGGAGKRWNGYDLRIEQVIVDYFRSVTPGTTGATSIGDVPPDMGAAFMDAAWDLARRGLLRPSPAEPTALRGVVGATRDDVFSLTVAGHMWASSVDPEQLVFVPADAGRFAGLIAPFVPLFGESFQRRAVEAWNAYRFGLYLAACAMAGAACEAVLIETAVALGEGRADVIKLYLTNGGTGRVLDKIARGREAWIRKRLDQSTQLLSYWRADAAHGWETAIGEPEAHAAVYQVVALAHFARKLLDPSAS